MRLFLRNIDLRPSCHNCQFKSVERVSDLTIGDAWGIEKVMPEFSDDKGTSLVLVHSQKGLDLLNMIYDKVYIKEGEIDTLLPVRSDARKSVEAHINRRLFFKTLQKSSGIECMEKYLSPSIPQRARLKIRRILKDITSRY
jgi:coenzyme F420-reducing hydrogenase beta subunit